MFSFPADIATGSLSVLNKFTTHSLQPTHPLGAFVQPVSFIITVLDESVMKLMKLMKGSPLQILADVA